MQVVESLERHEEEWKAALGGLVYEFGRLEVRVFLLCACFMTADDIRKIPLSKRLDRAIGYSKVQFGDRSAKLVELLIELKKCSKQRNSIVHGFLSGSVSMLGHHPSYIMTIGEMDSDCISLQETQDLVNRLNCLSEQLRELDTELNWFALSAKQTIAN